MNISINQESQIILEMVKECLDKNNGKLDISLINDIEEISIATYTRIDNTVAVCVIELPNGIKVTGNSCVLDEANFDEEVGREVAYENAVEKIWEVVGAYAMLLK